MIDEKLLKKLLGVEKTQPGRCVPKVWENGEQVLRLAGPRSWMIERYVKEAGKRAGVPLDWHFAGGRAVVLALRQDKEKACQALGELMPTFQEAAKQAVARGDENAYEVQILGWDPALNMFMFEDKA
jgi:hypothetical protein